MKNSDIRTEASESGIYLWEIGERLGKNDCNFSRMLRHELSDEKKAEIRAAIAAIKKER